MVELTNGQVDAFGLMVWSTGVASLDFIKGLDLPHNNQGRILTDRKLQVLNHPGIYSIGDCAVIEDLVYPTIAQVANQQAGYLAKVFNKKTFDSCKDFKYMHLGSMS